jgi:phosphoribosylamine--glycine ligase
LGVTASGQSLDAALQKAYAAAGKIHFDGMHYRKDIGQHSQKSRTAGD